MLSDRCLSVCLSSPVCNVGVLWQNGWTDQDETWHGGRPRPWPHCVRWGLSSAPQRAQPPQFSAYFVYCGQTAEWIKMPLGMKLGLGPGDIALDGDSAPLPKGHSHPNFRPMSVVAKWLDGSRCLLVRRYALAQTTLCYMGTQLPLQKRGQPQFLAHVYCGRTVAHLSYC